MDAGEYLGRYAEGWSNGDAETISAHLAEQANRNISLGRRVLQAGAARR